VVSVPVLLKLTTELAFVGRSNGGGPLTLQKLGEKLRRGGRVPIRERNFRMAFMRVKTIWIRGERSGDFLKLLADFPVVAEGVEDASDAPAVLIGNGMDNFGAGGDGMVERGVRVFNDHNHSYSTAPERFRAEIQMFGRFIGNPELGSAGGKLRDDRTVFPIDPVEHAGAERGFIEVNGLRTAANRQHRRDAGS
jgi:hypothetical protein